MHTKVCVLADIDMLIDESMQDVAVEISLIEQDTTVA